MNDFIASIDFGSNTFIVSILQCDENEKIIVVDEKIFYVRISEGMTTDLMILDHKMSLAISIVKSIQSFLQTYNVEKIIAVATGAFREAINGKEVCLKMEKELNAPINIIKGNQEAMLSLKSALFSRDSAFAVDIGGRSTECVFGNKKTVILAESFGLGSVKIKEMYFKQIPVNCESLADAERHCRLVLNTLAQYNVDEVVGISGLPITLACMDSIEKIGRMKIHEWKLEYDVICKYFKVFAQSSIDQICNIPGVDKHRADLMLSGTLILKEIMSILKAKTCIVCQYGIRHSAPLIFHQQVP